ncbi:MAG: hypothetical protein NTU49_00205 [Gammaproteobacteria bacterium]|nr:hypothetical protein [Gammaproteobacteria bacterium]
MITTACGIDVTETMLIEFTTGRMTCDFLNAGNYNAAYITPDDTRAPKAKLSDLAPTQFVAQTNGDEVRNLANIMDDPDRCVRLWNTYVLPRLLAAAKALNIPLTDPALVPAEICYFILPGNRRIKAWVAPFLIHTGPDISQSDIERFILDTYRGDPSLDIPGGRFLADAIVPGNIIRWHNILVTIDPGSLYTISPKKTLRLDSSHACLSEFFSRKFF